MNRPLYEPFARPLYVTVKPAGPACNLRCDYCYYLEKKGLYPNHPHTLMSDTLLERFTEQYLASQSMTEVMFSWHGGEALLRNMDFFRKALALQRRYGRGKKIYNSLQTNGTLLSDEWCKFFKDNNFLIGISLDGPEDCHDRYRHTAAGKPTFEQVMRGIRLLQKHGVEFNIMAVVNDYNADHPLRFYRFFKEIGAQFIRFSPIVEQIDDKPAPWNVPPEKWGPFLIAIFDEWVRNDVGKIFVQLFDSTLAGWMGVEPGVCTHARTCGHAGVMEFNGDVYSCDHFVYPDRKLGNIYRNTLFEMMYSDRQTRFGLDKHDTLPRKCLECRYLFACNGECPKNRLDFTPEGEPGLNRLCQGFYQYFHHTAPYMEFMAGELRARRSPANVMNQFK